MEHHSAIDVLSEKDCIAILKYGYFGHLGFLNAGNPCVMPINYFYDEGTIYSHSRLGYKITSMRLHPEVCFQVEEAVNLFKWKSIIIWGQYKEINGDDASRVTRHMIQSMQTRKDKLGDSSLELDFAAQLESAILYSIVPKIITGRSQGY